MKFVLMPDSLSAAWFRGVLATQGSVGVKVGTFAGLLDTLKSLWLLHDIEDVFDQTFKTAVIETNNTFWSKSIKVDEPSTLSELEASLKFILSVLPLNTSLDKISNPKSRIDHYFNDFVTLHALMGEVRPVDQMLGMQWLSQSDSDSIEPLELIYLPEFFAFDTWQIEVVERLSSLKPENAADEQVLKLLVDALEVSATKESDIQQLAKTLYKAPIVSNAICPENIRWLACRDSLQECEVLVGMVQSSLKQGLSIDEIAVVLPRNSEHLHILPGLLNRSGILTSNTHQSKTVLEWDVQLLKDLLVYFSFKKELKDAASPMSMAAVLTNPLMPWSLNRGQRYADMHFSGVLKEKVDENGFTAFQIALSQADRNKSYATKKLALIYEEIEPASMSIQVDGRLIKLDNHQMEFFMLNMMIALFYRALPEKIIYQGGAFSTQDFIDAIENIPNSVLPERRKKRAYLSSILSKNEMDKDDKTNRKLFMRIKRGAYLFNPNLSIKVEGNWINIYELLSLDKLAHRHRGDQQMWQIDINKQFTEILELNKATLKQQLQEKRQG